MNENQYIIENWWKGIIHLCQHFDRTRDAIWGHIGTLRREGYFDALFDDMKDSEIIKKYVYDVQDFHYSLLQDLKKDLEKQRENTEKMIMTNLEMHHLMFKELADKLKKKEN